MECAESGSDCSDDYDFYDNEDPDADEISAQHSSQLNANNLNNDPEYVEYKCFFPDQLVEIFNKSIELLIQPPLSIRKELAQLLLHLNNWNVALIRQQLIENYDLFLQNSNIKASHKSLNNNELKFKKTESSLTTKFCYICYNNTKNAFNSLDCKHLFCEGCWLNHIEIQLQNGLSTKIECMNLNCHLICPKEFVLQILSSFDGTTAKSAQLRLKYEQMYFRDMINSHPHLRWCPGRNCSVVIYCVTNKAHRVTCKECESSFCFLCGQTYHAPASLPIRRIAQIAILVLKNLEVVIICNAQNANIIFAGHAYQVNKSFFKQIGLDWKSHGNEYYECSRYKENPALAQEATHMKARRALERYLHYYERFENHNKSLKMEEELKQKIKAQIELKISRHEGTWIDWQYLHSASHLLTKCRYTLQYTYPFAYYMDQSFEYQQAQLEKEIEELSWKVERSTTSDIAINGDKSVKIENNRGDLENQMLRVELSRRTLLRDFLS